MDNETLEKLKQLAEQTQVFRKTSLEETPETPIYSAWEECWIESDAQFRERIKKAGVDYAREEHTTFQKDHTTLKDELDDTIAAAGIHADEHRKARDENTALRTMLGEMVLALKFYAEKRNIEVFERAVESPLEHREFQIESGAVAAEALAKYFASPFAKKEGE